MCHETTSVGLTDSIGLGKGTVTLDDMAIEMAKKVNLTLASFCRGDGFVLYTE